MPKRDFFLTPFTRADALKNAFRFSLWSSQTSKRTLRFRRYLILCQERENRTVPIDVRENSDTNPF